MCVCVLYAIRHACCIKALAEKSVNPQIINLIISFLNNRRHATSFGGHISNWKSCNMGIGQGTIQGPILFITAFDSVVLNCTSIRYADDLIKILTPEDNARDSLDDMKLKCEEIGLTLNVEKTVEMIICKRNKTSVDIPHSRG